MDRTKDLSYIREEFQYIGLKEFPEKAIADMINSGKDKLQVTGELKLSQYGNREDMEYKIFLKKYDRINQYQPYMYQATLKSDPEKSRAFRVSAEPGFTLHDAFNLLNGRAVQKLVLDLAERKLQLAWFQLDFKKKDVHGNFDIVRLDVNPKEYAVNDALSRYPIKELMNPDDRVKLLISLHNGNAEPVTLLKEGKEMQGFVQASPWHKTVDVYTPWDGKMIRVKKESVGKAEKPQEPQPESIHQKKRKPFSL